MPDIPEQLVKLAALGTSGLSIFAMFWVGYIITRKDESKNIEAHKNIRFYMLFCLSICLISVASVIWGGGGKPDSNSGPYTVYGTVIVGTNANIFPGGISFNADAPSPSVGRSEGDIRNLFIYKNASGKFPSINLSGIGYVPIDFSIQAEIDAKPSRVEITDNIVRLLRPISMEKMPDKPTGTIP